MAPKLVLVIAALLAFLEHGHTSGDSFVITKAHRFEDNTYTLVMQPRKSHHDAIKACESNGLMLATVKSREEMDFYKKYASEKSLGDGQVWLNAGRPKGDTASFTWGDDKSAVDKSFFQTKPTYSSVGNACLSLQYKKGPLGLVDGWCSQTYAFMCRTIVPVTVPPEDQNKPNQPPAMPAFTCIGKECGYYAMEKNCAGFYVCSEDKTKVEPRFCPHDLLFKTETTMCDIPSAVDCRGRPIASPFDCKDKKCGHYEDEKDCSSYYVCSEDRTDVGHKTCEHGLMFNRTEGICALPETVTCTV